jgi:hypothetical protein
VSPLRVLSRHVVIQCLMTNHCSQDDALRAVMQRVQGGKLRRVLFTYELALNVVVEWLTLLLRVPKVPGSNLGLEVVYPDCFRGFLQYLG